MNPDASTEVSTRILGADADGVAAAIAILQAGGLVAIPTETVYGLAADATRAEAAARIYAAKGRPAFNPLIAHCHSLAQARREGVFNADALRLAEAFWPGPLTLVVPVASSGSVCELARAGLSSVALRVPSHPLALALIEGLGRPVAAPSANRSGHVSPTSAAHVLGDLGGRINAVLDSGPCQVGIESTIVACLDEEPRLLRAGGIARAALEAVLGRALADPAEEGDKPAAPGMLASHYAPRAQLRLNARAPRPGEAFLGFGGVPPGRPEPTIDLSPAGDTVEAAARLYDALRQLDAALGGGGVIAVAPMPSHGLGEAINDRLRRAAAPR